jgi:phosphoglycolate phosphatase
MTTQRVTSAAAVECAAVLFDLDGTLLDTAPDMVGALNELLAEYDRAPLPFAALRPYVSHGSYRLVRLGFEEAGDTEHEALRQRFLTLYGARVARATLPFDGIPEVLATLERAAIPWGIVTNKPGRLTDDLLAALNLDTRAACVVNGDTLPERKPHPMPLEHAARIIGVSAQACVYVGDAERDMVAANRAGMPGIVARYGYIPAEERADDWPAIGAIDHPRELLFRLSRAA